MDTTYTITVTKDATYTAVFKLEATLIYYADGTIEATNEETLTGYSSNTDIVKLEVGSSCTTINNGAFQGCTNLKIEKIPEGVTTIGSNAFTGCTSLERLEIPNAGNTTYGWQPFSNCTGLKEVIMGGINKPVSTIPTNIFLGCTQKGLTIKIYVESGTTSLENAPWGATNATIEYYDSTTGERIN